MALDPSELEILLAVVKASGALKVEYGEFKCEFPPPVVETELPPPSQTQALPYVRFITGNE